MRRNLGILREALLAIEEQAPQYSSALPRGRWSTDAWNHHIGLLIDAGYVRGESEDWGGDGSPGYFVDRLTMMGSDFLAAIRDPDIFVSVRQQIEKEVGDAPLSVVVDLAENHIRRRIFLVGEN